MSHPSNGHTRNAPSYSSAELGRPSTLGDRERSGLTQRSPSPSPTKATFGFDRVPEYERDRDREGEYEGRDPSGPIALDRSLAGSAGMSGGGVGWKGLTPQRIGRAIGARFMRAVRRGNLPFLLVFFSCTLVFFSALAGVGYHEPLDSVSPTAGGTPAAVAAAGPGEFRVGGPVFDDRTASLERRIAEQRALEESWAKKRRPKDGAWMRKQRDDKAIRRVRPTAVPQAEEKKEHEAIETSLADTGDDAVEGLEKREAPEEEARAKAVEEIPTNEGNVETRDGQAAV
ncbi:hypothetical protein IAU60_005565 [Kwoniella sp. DSM 27419]